MASRSTGGLAATALAMRSSARRGVSSTPCKSLSQGAGASCSTVTIRDVSGTRRAFPVRDPPTKVSLLEVFVWFPTSEVMVLSQQALQVGTRVSPKWGSYRGEPHRI